MGQEIKREKNFTINYCGHYWKSYKCNDKKNNRFAKTKETTVSTSDQSKRTCCSDHSIMVEMDTKKMYVKDFIINFSFFIFFKFNNKL